MPVFGLALGTGGLWWLVTDSDPPGAHPARAPRIRDKGGRGAVQVGGQHLEVTNLHKVLYPQAGFTKGELISFYLDVAPALLPHIRHRPLTVRRFPDGIDGDSFFEKHPPRGAPSWIPTVSVPRSGRTTAASMTMPLVEDLRALVWFANLASIEFHVPMWRVDRAGRPSPPDLMVLDLDPGDPAGIVECAEVALLLEHVLRREHGWTSHVKTSGSKGLQIYIGLPERDRQRRWDDGGTRDEARHIAQRMAREHPELIVANMRRDLRAGKVLIDWSQNSVSKTTVAPYSLRARPEPTVSTPLKWEEVERCSRRGRPEELQFVASQVPQRLENLGDLFAPLAG